MSKRFSGFRNKKEESGVFITGANGHGTTNTNIRYFNGTIRRNVGKAISYVTNSAAGDSFLINEEGIYSIDYGDRSTAGAATYGISVNSTELTTTITGIAAADRLTWTNTQAANHFVPVSATYRLLPGDTVRAHTNAAPNETTDLVYFRVTKLAGLRSG